MLAALALFCALVSPAGADALSDCNDAADPGVRIRGCTGIIESEPPADVLAIALMNRAIGKAAQGRLDDALVDLDAALATDPNLLSAIYNRGNVYLDLGHIPEAIMDFDVVVRRMPGFAYGWLNRGLAHEAAGDFADARADLEKALRLDPTLAAARRALDRLKAKK